MKSWISMAPNSLQKDSIKSQPIALMPIRHTAKCEKDVLCISKKPQENFQYSGDEKERMRKKE